MKNVTGTYCAVQCIYGAMEIIFLLISLITDVFYCPSHRAVRARLPSVIIREGGTPNAYWKAGCVSLRPFIQRYLNRWSAVISMSRRRQCMYWERDLLCCPQQVAYSHHPGGCSNWRRNLLWPSIPGLVFRGHPCYCSHCSLSSPSKWGDRWWGWDVPPA